MAIDGREHVLRLLGHAFAGRVAGDDAGEIDGIAMDHDLAHAWPGIETLDGHLVLPIFCGRFLSARARHAPLRFLQRPPPRFSPLFLQIPEPVSYTHLTL